MTLPESKAALPGQRLDAPLKGLWGPWPPIAKLLFLLAPALGLMLAQGWPCLLCLWTVALAAHLLTWPDSEWIWTRLLPMSASIAFFAIWLPWTLPGEPIFEGQWWSPGWDGSIRGLSLFLKGTGVALGFLSVVRSFQQTELLATLQKLAVPRLLLTIGWITVQQTQRLLREWKNLSQAHRARGAYLGERTDRTRLMANSWAQLFVRAQKRSDDLGDALKGRAFCRNFESFSFLSQPAPARSSTLVWLAAALQAIFILGVLAVDRWGPS